MTPPKIDLSDIGFNDIDLNDAIQPFWKPAGWSSFDVIRKTRRITRARKIGHAGTLDPFATGILILCFGKATKRVPDMMDLDKEYEGTVLLGTLTDTLDPTGQVTQTGAVPALSKDALAQALTAFVGTIDQVPPMYSALKRGGRRLYQLAREGQQVDLQPRPVRVDRIELLSWSPPDTFSMRVTCGKGTYIRALARDIAAALGTVGHLKQLCRTRVGPYGREQAITMEQIGRWTPIAN